MLKEPQDLIQIIQESSKEKNDRSLVGNLIKAIINDAKKFLNELSVATLKRVFKQTYRVEVSNQIKLPNVQKIEGKVSLKEIREVVIGLNEIVKKLDTLEVTNRKSTTQLEKSLKPVENDPSPIVKAIKDIKIPETKIPAPLSKIEITNLKELKDLLLKMLVELQKPTETVVIPPYPKTMTVGNLDKVEGLLADLNKPEKEDEPIAFNFDTDDTGNLKTFTEIYPDGEVISTGWSIGRVKIKDTR